MFATQHKACNDMVVIRPQIQAVTNELKERGRLVSKEEAEWYIEFQNDTHLPGR